MAGDNSIATQMEDWIVTQIKTLQFGGGPLFDPADVEPFHGIEEGRAFEDIAGKLFQGKRTRWCVVLPVRDEVQDLEEGDIRLRTTYAILVGVENQRRPGAARRGDDTSPGANVIRDLLRSVLHTPPNAGPAVTDGITKVDDALWAGAEMLSNTGTRVVMRCTVVAVEGRKA